jgi:hypothetical protein
MSFWQTSDNQQLDTSGNFEIGGGEPIPANTALRVMATDAKWDTWEGEESIKIRWDVIDGEYKNRVVFQKLKVKDADTKKRDKALKMLAAIDANAGGKLMALGSEPSDMDLAQCLLQKPMWIKVQVWEIDGKSGNWVAAVSGGVKSGATEQAPKPGPVVDDGGVKIPF